MKPRLLPLENELNSLTQEGRHEDAAKLAAGLLLETINTRGWQLVLGVLRNLERGYYRALVAAAAPADRMVGALQAIESIRHSLTAILAVGDRESVDFFDDEAVSSLDRSVPEDPDT